MNRTYALDTQSAKQAGASSYINETGKYIGTFIRAEEITSRQQTEGIEFTFKSTDERTCDYLTCWTYSPEGKELYGLKMLNALMTCMRVRDIAPRIVPVKNRDGLTRQASMFTDLMDKPIGVLLQREEYEKQDGSLGFKFNVVGCFDARTEMTASEVLDKAAKPEQLGKWVAQLKDKPMQRRAFGAPATTRAPATVGSSLADMDDDIPF